MEPRSGEQMSDRHAVASGEDETQHDENRTRDIHSGKRGSETTPEEEPENVRKTAQSEQEPSNSASSSTMHVSLQHPASGERQDRTGPVLVQNSGHVDDDI